VLGGLALQVGDLLGLGVSALLIARELVLGLALALLLASLALQRAVAGDVAGGLFGAARDLVDGSSKVLLSFAGQGGGASQKWDYPTAL
jgi:hypothetical protein